MSDYDYTSVPFDENPDDFLIGNVANAADKTAEQIELENRFLSVPPGKQTLEVLGFFGPPEKGYQRVFVNGQLVGFEAYSVSVKFGHASNHRETITDRFVLPPGDAASLKAYFHGVPEARENGIGSGKPSKMAPGILGNRFAQFIHRLGFVWPLGGAFPVEAQKIGNWKGRKVNALVKAGSGTYKAKDGSEKARDNQINWFSYEPFTGTVLRAAAPGTVRNLPGLASAPQPELAAAAVADAGLDVI